MVALRSASFEKLRQLEEWMTLDNVARKEIATKNWALRQPW